MSPRGARNALRAMRTRARIAPECIVPRHVRRAALFWLRLGAQALAEKHAVVIGAGIAGLAAAQQLQMSGFRLCRCKRKSIHTSACSLLPPPP